MKTLGTQLISFMDEPAARGNVRALVKYLLFLAALITVFSVIFHAIMEWEGQNHSWLTGVYWTVTVMSTLGFGDITFHSDLGRMFSMMVLFTGTITLLIVLPFLFIRFFYAPWLENQLKTKAPRSIRAGVTGHVVLFGFDAIGAAIVERLRLLKIKTYVLVDDAAKATQLLHDGWDVVTGDHNAEATWKSLRVSDARAVITKDVDTHNTAITLSVRHQSDDTAVIATAEEFDSVDILELAGATHVLPLKTRLGEQMASRVNTGHAEAHPVGGFGDLTLAEFAVHGTPLVGKKLGDLTFEEQLGISFVGVWNHGAFSHPTADTEMLDDSVLIVLGTAAQIAAVNEVLTIYDNNDHPVIVIGGGKVGCAAAAALRRIDVPVVMVEKDPALEADLSQVCDRVVIGNANDIKVIEQAGIRDAPSVLLTTNDDSINLYLTLYCRRLNPGLRIVSRVNLAESIDLTYRAGADFVMSDASLAAASVASLLRGRELTMLGAGIDLVRVGVPSKVAGRTLGNSNLASKTGVSVIAIHRGDDIDTNPSGNVKLDAEMDLLLLGTPEQHTHFFRLYS